jgi:hypothetical protein
VPSRYFGSRYFAANFFAASGAASADITATLDATEAADTLVSSATLPVEEGVFGSFAVPRFFPRDPIIADLDVMERGDTLQSTVTLGFDPVAMDNDWLLVAA